MAAYKDTFAQLTVTETDVDWGNVTFVAGMRNLVQLCVSVSVGDVTYDLLERSVLLTASRLKSPYILFRGPSKKNEDFCATSQTLNPLSNLHHRSL